jgi:hypothetical protein
LALPLLLNFLYLDYCQTRDLLSDGPREVLSTLRSAHNVAAGETRLIYLDMNPDMSPAWHYYKHLLTLDDLRILHLKTGELTQEKAKSYDYLYVPVETYGELGQHTARPFLVLGWFKERKYVLLANADRPDL